MIAPIKVHSGLKIVVTNPFGKVAPHLKDWYIKHTGKDIHNGIDLVLSGKRYQSYGAELLAPFDGKVVQTRKNEPMCKTGNLVKILSIDGRFMAQHHHCSKVKVNLGDVVTKGDTLALMGNSGLVRPIPTLKDCFNGTHTHFMLWEMIDGKWTLIDPNRYIDWDKQLAGADTSIDEDVPPLAWVINTLQRDVKLLAQQIKDAIRQKNKSNN